MGHTHRVYTCAQKIEPLLASQLASSSSSSSSQRPRTFLSQTSKERDPSPLFLFPQWKLLASSYYAHGGGGAPLAPRPFFVSAYTVYTNQLCVRPVIYQQAGKRAVGKPSFPPPPSFTFHIKNGPKAPRERESMFNMERAGRA